MEISAIFVSPAENFPFSHNVGSSLWALSLGQT